MKPLDQFLSSQVLAGDMETLLRDHQDATDSFHRSNQRLAESKHKIFAWCDSVLRERESLIAEVSALKGKIETILGEDRDRDTYLANLQRDVTELVTSPLIRKLDPLIFETYSGSVYELVGPPDPQFVIFCSRIGKQLDVSDPVKWSGQNPMPRDHVLWWKGMAKA